MTPVTRSEDKAAKKADKRDAEDKTEDKAARKAAKVARKEEKAKKRKAEEAVTVEAGEVDGAPGRAPPAAHARALLLCTRAASTLSRRCTAPLAVDPLVQTLQRCPRR